MGLIQGKSMWGLWYLKGDGAVLLCQLQLGQCSYTHPSSGAITRGYTTKVLKTYHNNIAKPDGISGFWRNANEICTLQQLYAA